MKQYYKYQLQKYSGRDSRYICPNCGRPSFVRYVDEYNNCISSDCGVCEHQHSCGYSLSPKEYFATHPNEREHFSNRLKSPQVVVRKPSIQVSFLLIQQSCSTDNYLMQFLSKYFPDEILKEVTRKYFLGSTPQKEIIFPQLDEALHCRSGKVMRYNPADGHRVKDSNFDRVNWLHKKFPMETKGEQLEQCLFGLHLIKENKPICLVESEKSAVICALASPNYTWLSCGGKNGFKESLLKPLQGRRVTVFPDADAFDEWSEAAKKIKCCHVEISDWCKNEPEGSKRDIADLIIEQLEQKKQELNKQTTLGEFLQYAVEAGVINRVHLNV